VNEKDARETLHIDRRTGQMTLNGKLPRLMTRVSADEIAAGEIPYGKEKVIPCYGIIGILSLATSMSASRAPSWSKLTISRLSTYHHRSNKRLSTFKSANLPSYRLPATAPITLIELGNNP
jgi:hypothetical protein